MSIILRYNLHYCGSDLEIRTFWPGTLVLSVEWPRPDGIGVTYLIPRYSNKNSLWKLVKTFERDPTVGSRDTDVLTRYSTVGGMAPTGRHRRDLPIPFYSIENSLRKLVKTFERDPTVGSRDTDVLTRYSAVGGMASTGRHRRVVPDSTLLHRKQPSKTREKIWARSNDRISRYGRFDPVL